MAGTDGIGNVGNIDLGALEKAFQVSTSDSKSTSNVDNTNQSTVQIFGIEDTPPALAPKPGTNAPQPLLGEVSGSAKISLNLQNPIPLSDTPSAAVIKGATDHVLAQGKGGDTQPAKPAEIKQWVTQEGVKSLIGDINASLKGTITKGADVKPVSPGDLGRWLSVSLQSPTDQAQVLQGGIVKDSSLGLSRVDIRPALREFGDQVVAAAQKGEPVSIGELKEMLVNSLEGRIHVEIKDPNSPTDTRAATRAEIKNWIDQGFSPTPNK